MPNVQYSQTDELLLKQFDPPSLPRWKAAWAMSARPTTSMLTSSVLEAFMEEGFEGIVMDETVDGGKDGEALLGAAAELALRL